MNIARTARMNRTRSLTALALAGGICLTMVGCGAMGGPLGKSPLLGHQRGSNAALSKVVKNDPFPTAAQAGLSNQSIAKK